MRDARIGTAYHEAGHAVVGITRGFRIVHATIRPARGVMGHVQFSPNAHATPLSWLIVNLGGVCGGALVGVPTCLDAYPMDRDAVEALLCRHHGRTLNSRTQSPLYCRALVATHALANQLELPIGIVARQLLKRETLNHQDILEALNPYHRRAA